MKKTVSVILCMLMLILPLNILSFAVNDVDYTITNPYENVDFSAVNYYKADMHCHTTQTDGDNTLKEMVERHYELGFDIMSITDHGTSNYSWTENHVSPAVKFGVLFKEGLAQMVCLDENGGTAENGKTYTLTTDEDGNQFYAQENGKQMLRIPFGIENNPTSFNNAHVNSWFVDYGDGVLGGTSDYETPISNVDALGGLSVINHPGEYSGARDETYTEDAYNLNNLHYKYVISKFENLLLEYDTCLGIDINSKGDYRTRFDRKLWDILLTDLTKAGRNVYAMGSTDAHNLNIVDSGYDIVLSEDLTVDSVKNAFANGNFFAGSCCIGNVDELKGYVTGLSKNSDETAQSIAESMSKAISAIDAEIADGSQSTEFKFDSSKPIAQVNGVNIDETEDVISLDVENGYYTRWIADGEVIAEGNTIDLDDYSDKIGTYVRAEIIGEGGILYTQAFMLTYEGAEEYTPISEMKDYGSFTSTFADLPVNILGLFKDLFYAIIKLLNIGI